jgi:hypothetical protein
MEHSAPVFWKLVTLYFEASGTYLREHGVLHEGI